MLQLDSGKVSYVTTSDLQVIFSSFYENADESDLGFYSISLIIDELLDMIMDHTTLDLDEIHKMIDDEYEYLKKKRRELYAKI